jgi:hypothetical protein
VPCEEGRFDHYNNRVKAHVDTKWGDAREYRECSGDREPTVEELVQALVDQGATIQRERWDDNHDLVGMTVKVPVDSGKEFRKATEAATARAFRKGGGGV